MRYLRSVVCPAVFTILIFGMACGLTAHAANKPAGPAPVDPRILVAAVDVAKNEITIIYKRNGKKAVYTFDTIAKITVNNNEGTIKEIEVGQQVYSYVEHDAHSLDSITVGIARSGPVVLPKK